MDLIPYNRPFITGEEGRYIQQAMASGHLSGAGSYALMCQDFFKNHYGLGACMFTSSCSQALEIIARLCDLGPGDEVLMPAFNYPTVASAFASTGATLIFTDSEPGRPHVSAKAIAGRIGPKTKVVVAMHYAGQACEMDMIQALAHQHNLLLVEDCAHATNATYKNRQLGSFGHFSVFSFHETKNIHCGEGGMLVVNDERFVQRADIIWREGTNRKDFERGLVAKYEWVDLGSSYQASELNAAFLYAQLEQVEPITQRRLHLWNIYFEGLKSLAENGRITIPDPGPGHNAHIFYFACEDRDTRDRLLAHMNELGISAIFHYLPLHLSPFWLKAHPRQELGESERWSNCIVRLPLYIELKQEHIAGIISAVHTFYETNH